MTLTQAKACAAAAVDAGYDAALTKTATDTWKVRVISNAIDIDVAAASGLATTQGVSGKIALIDYT